jgi:hypothetical protein
MVIFVPDYNSRPLRPQIPRHPNRQIVQFTTKLLKNHLSSHNFKRNILRDGWHTGRKTKKLAYIKFGHM